MTANEKIESPIKVEPAQGSVSIASTQGVTEERVWDALRQCYDPEIPVNIVDLGLVVRSES